MKVLQIPLPCLDYISITICKEMKILSSQKHYAIFLLQFANK